MKVLWKKRIHGEKEENVKELSFVICDSSQACLPSFAMRDSVGGCFVTNSDENTNGSHFVINKRSSGDAGSDTSSDDGNVVILPLRKMLEKIECSCNVHNGVELVNEKFGIDVDLAFNCIFTESQFIRKHYEQRKISDTIISPWNETSLDDGRAAKSRQLTYTVTINHALAKTVLTKEVQVLLQEYSGKAYVVQSDVANSGVPYSDTFTVRSKWCLTRGQRKNECYLRVHAAVTFKKLNWAASLMKAYLEKTALEGVSDFCKDLVTGLHKFSHTISKESLDDEADSPEACGISPNLPMENCSITSEERGAGPLHLHSTSGSPSTTVATGDTFLLKIILFVLLVLLALNVLLYYRLWQLESVVVDDEILPATSRGESALPNEALIAKWRRIVTNAITLMKDVERSLTDAKYKFDDEL